MTPSDHTGPHRINMPTWISPAPFEHLLGMEIVKAEAGEAILRMPFLKTLAQGAGLMHGGALVSLADTAVVMAIKSIVAPETQFVTTVLESRFLYPVSQGTATARATVEARRNDALNGRCSIFDDSDRLVVRFSSTFKIVNGDAKRENLSDADSMPVSIPAGDPN